MTKCRLCDRDGLKMAESHIVPKSLYGTTLTSKAGPARIVSGAKETRPSRSPKGVYDKQILCIDCEASLSAWDEYAFDIFTVSVPTPIVNKSGVTLASKYEEVDQHKLQMFFISLVWRMQVTSQPMFAGMKLGPYEEKFKAAIISKSADMLPEFDVVVSKFDDKLANAFMGPSRLRIEGVNGFRIGFAHHLCWVKIDKREFPDPFNKIALSKGSPLHILFREFDDSPEKRAMVQIAKQS